MRTYYVYILASRSRRLYVGVTGRLSGRLREHRAGCVTFTAKYKIDRLVYIESTNDIRAAITREKQLKGWRRERKLDLIDAANPTWDELLPRPDGGPQAGPSLRSG